MSKPDIIWWSIDSVRRDRCSSYGYSRPTTPNFSEVGTQLIGRSHGTWTLPSVTSILTLQDAKEHGVMEQGDQLSLKSETVPARLQSAGYQTIGLAANPWVSRGSGLNIGFEEFYNIDEDGSLLKAVGWKRALQFVARIRQRGGGFTTDPLYHPTDWLMIALARQRLKRSPDSNPSFLYLHTKGCHSVNQDFHPPPSWVGKISTGETRSDRYDDLLSWVDSLWPWFEPAIPDDAIVIVTSDHGELLGEDGLFGHDHDHPLLHEVPLWIRGIDCDWSDGDTSHIDVMRCLLSKIDVSTDACDIETVSMNSGKRVSDEMEEKLSALGYR